MAAIDGPDDPHDPQFWPEAPWDATYRDGGHWWTWVGTGWTVPRVPPGPFPFVDPQFPRAGYGPPGTVWVFSEADMLAGLAGLPGNPTRSALNALIRKLGVQLGAGSLLAFRTPYVPRYPTLEEPMRWIHVSIIGKYGPLEQVCHTLNFRTNPADADQDAAAIATFAGQVRDHFTAFLNDTDASRPQAAKLFMTPDLVYTEVRAAYLEQTGAAVIGSEQGKRGPRKTYEYPRPAYLVPTQYAMFAANSTKGTGTDPALPYEVALALTHTTGLRGPRNRGRVYLAGLTTGAMQAGGVFNSQTVQNIAQAWGKRMVNGLNTDTGNRLHVVSRAYGTSVGVNGVSVGVVPDSQRRRRRSQLEGATAQWAPTP